MHIRNQQKSNGDLYTWRWADGLGNNYMGPLVEMTVTHKKLSDKERERLEKVEARIEAVDAKIRRDKGV